MPTQGKSTGRPPGLLINPDAARYALADRPQSWLARSAKVSPGGLSEVLTGQKGVTEEIANRISGALEVPVGMLFPELVEFTVHVRHFTAPKWPAAA